jgi:hypothetical protein
MDFVFTNGSAVQQDLWASSLNLLNHLPNNAIPITVTVTFEPPTEIGQTAFAETTSTYDSPEAATKVRNDAPGFGDADQGLIAEAAAWGLRWEQRRFYTETAIHELGHALYAALPEKFRLAIARMFGAKSDDPAEINPEGKDWHDRVSEAIAETFKEAFLPSRHRVFPNRTNLKLDYSEYPAFRRLFREGVETIPAESGVPIGEQMASLPLIESFTNLEEEEDYPLTLPWTEWSPADAIGGIISPAFDPTTGYGTAQTHSLVKPHAKPRRVAALYTDIDFSNDFAAAVRLFSDWNGDNDQMYFDVFAAATNEGGGRGYRVVALREEQGTFNGLTYPVAEKYSSPGGPKFIIRLERWQGGSLAAVLDEKKEVKMTAGSYLGISVANGLVRGWVSLSELGTFTNVTIGKDDTFESGYCGVGINRNDGALNNSYPRLRSFRAGPIDAPFEGGGEVLVPDGRVVGGDYSVDRRTVEKRVSGWRG